MVNNNKNITEKLSTLPVLAVRGLVFFPGMILQFDVGRERSMQAVNQAVSGNRKIFLVAQRDLSENEPTAEGVYSIGVIAKIKQVIQRSEEGIKLHVEGLVRGEIQSTLSEDPYIKAQIREIVTPPYRKTAKTEAMTRIVHEKFDSYIHLFKRIPPDVMLGVLKETDCGALADYITSNIAIDYERKQYILDEVHPVKRLGRLIDLLTDENKILTIENEINKKTQEQIDDNQRDYYLKEQMRIIAAELGEEDSPQQEADELKEKVLALGLNEVCQTKMLKECEKLYKMPFGSHEASVIRVYLDTCLSLPWNNASKEKLDLARAKRVLDRDHYGLEKVKERFVEILAVRKLAPQSTGQIICLVGPPGVGKTSIARSIAEATGRKYVRVSLGGISDEAEIMGHRKTYVGSMPGRILNAVKQAGTNNPLILLDEIDKLGTNFKGDPASALLEVLDPEQNTEFTDHYLDLPFSLANVLFITTANDPGKIPGPLYDRMDIITLGSYTQEEKANIAAMHLVKKQREKHGIQPGQLKFTSAAVNGIIQGYTREAGVRTLERKIAAICRKTAKMIVSDKDFKSLTVKLSGLEELLGPKRFAKDKILNYNVVGLVNGLAWTSVGGELLPIEVAVVPGNGKIQLTGSLGNVMKESANTAITCIRTRAKLLGISPDFYEKNDIHVHAPEGAVPKDGPSAGVAMATAITSALCAIPARCDVAMTGEITLQGRVLPIGGLREKAMAAYKNGVQTVLIPEENLPDLADVDSVVKENVRFVPLRAIDTALEHALEYMPMSKQDSGEKASAIGNEPPVVQKQPYPGVYL